MSPPLFVQLAQLENQLLRGKILKPHYASLKWDILQLIYKNKEVVAPIYKDKCQRETLDDNGKCYCYVPPGPFIFGPDAEYGIVHAGFYMAKYPVTVKEFGQFLEETGYAYSDEDYQIMMEISPQQNCPVSNISWLDAKEYCRWLRKSTNEYYSLPSEFEWEYTARGIDGRVYPWGHKEINHDLACYSDQEIFDCTVPCGCYPKNISPFGCMDMVGNVWEWCLDDFDDEMEPHVLRGGSWLHDQKSANCFAKIFSYPPEKRSDYSGFRLMYLPGDLFDAYQQQINESFEEEQHGQLKKVGFAVDPPQQIIAEKSINKNENGDTPKLKKIGKVLPKKNKQ